jgi:ABC-type transport system involved in cytochrome c biogenesis permease subunit
MMTPDPILDSLRMFFFRVFYFVLITVVMSLLIFRTFMSTALEVDVSVLPPSFALVCVPSDVNVTAIIASLSMSSGMLLTTVIFMMVARWWRRRSELPRRGARLESEEVRK